VVVTEGVVAELEQLMEMANGVVDEATFPEAVALQEQDQMGPVLEECGLGLVSK